MNLLISPTGYGIRIADPFGYGHYLAPRGDRLHLAEDYYCEPGQDIYAPIAGEILRDIINVYERNYFRGVVLRNHNMELKLLYISPKNTLIGKWVKQGQTIGTAQDIRDRYRDITPHVHLEIIHIRPSLLME